MVEKGIFGTLLKLKHALDLRPRFRKRDLRKQKRGTSSKAKGAKHSAKLVHLTERARKQAKIESG